MTPDDLHYLITRLNGVSGTLSNHADGTKTITQARAEGLLDSLGEVVERVRAVYEATRTQEPQSVSKTATKSATVVDWDFFELVTELQKAWRLESSSSYLLGAGNDTTHDFDLSDLKEDDFEEAQKNRDKRLAEFASGGVEEYRYRELLILAVHDGILKPARYIVQLSW